MKYLEILIKLRKIIRSINLESKKIEKQFGISIPQLLVLQYLSDQEDYAATAKAIKEHIMLNASTVSGIVQRLEDKRLIAKIPSKHDKRSVKIILSALGAKLLEQSPTTLQEKLSRRLMNLSQKQIAELDANIELLTQIMDVDDVDAAPLITADDLIAKSKSN